MPPGKIVRYTKDSGGFRWAQIGVDVDPDNPLEVVAPDVADLVDGDPTIPLEKYPAGDLDTDITIVDGLDIAPNTVSADGVTAGATSTRTLSYRHGGAVPASPIAPTSPVGPTNLVPAPGLGNPLYTKTDVTDITAKFVADHFIGRRPGGFDMLAEVTRNSDGQQFIGHWSGPSPTDLTYQNIVMDDSLTGSTAISYPLFVYDPAAETWYVAPSHGGEGNTNGLYEASTWPPTGPSDFSLVETATQWGSDNFVWRYNDVWYAVKSGALYHNTDETLVSPNWVEQASITPTGTPSGRPIVYDDFVDLPFSYGPGNDGGRALRLWRSSTLDTSTTGFEVVEPAPIVGGTGPSDSNWWNSDEVHHLDVAKTVHGQDVWLVDGRQSTQAEWSIGAYVPGGHRRMLATAPIANPPLTIGPGGANDNLPIQRGLDYSNVIDTGSDEIVVRERGVYEVSVRLVVDADDAITTPFDVDLRMYDGSNNVWGTRTVTITTASRTDTQVTEKTRIPVAVGATPSASKLYIANNGDQSIDLLGGTYWSVERTATQ